MGEKVIYNNIDTPVYLKKKVPYHLQIDVTDTIVDAEMLLPCRCLLIKDKRFFPSALLAVQIPKGEVMLHRIWIKPYSVAKFLNCFLIFTEPQMEESFISPKSCPAR